MGALLFVDGSCDPNSKIGYGAMLFVPEGDCRSPGHLKEEVAVCRFYPCTSSSLELETLLWAWGKLGEKARTASVMTDSQTIVGLPARRATLEASNFCSRGGKPLRQGELYRSFYDVFDRLSPRVEKIRGHQPKTGKTRDDLLFSLVDKASRSALRSEV